MHEGLKDSPSYMKERTVPRDFFDPTPEQHNVALIDTATLREAERLIESCEHCNPEGAEISFNCLVDLVHEADPSVMTDYVLEQPVECPNCRREILGTTLIEPADFGV